MSIRTLFSTLTDSATSLVEGTTKVGSFVGEHLHAYAEDKALRDLERSVARNKRLEDIAKQMAKCQLTEADLQEVKTRHNRIKDFMIELTSENK